MRIVPTILVFDSGLGGLTVLREIVAARPDAHYVYVADAKIFHKSYGDQNGELWSPSGRLLATTTQIAYFKA